jgi:MFS family permease
MVNAVDMPTRQAFVMDMVGREDLMNAVTLNSSLFNASRIIGPAIGGLLIGGLGLATCFYLNGLSFLAVIAGLLAMRISSPGRPATLHQSLWVNVSEGLGYVWRTPLVLGIGLISVGWAAGGGAAQILFVLFAEQVFHRGAQGIGALSGFAGIGLLVGGVAGHLMGRRIGFKGYKHAVSVSYISHGLAYVLFSLTPNYGLALVMMAVSRVGMAVTSVLNYFQLMKHTPDEYRGRVFATMESLRWSTMMLSFAAAGIASNHFTPREIGVVAGLLGGGTGLLWAIANWRRRLPEPKGR